MYHTDLARRAICVALLTLSLLRTSDAGQCFYSVQKDTKGVWWLVDPSGKALVHKGVTSVALYANNCAGTCPLVAAATKLFPANTETAWTNEAVNRLTSWGFTGLGCYASGMAAALKPYYLFIGLVTSANLWDDYFDPKVQAQMRSIAYSTVIQTMNDPLLIGYYSDNELYWGQEGRGNRSMLLTYIASLPNTASGHIQAINFITSRYSTISALNQAWGTSLTTFADLARVTFPFWSFGTAARLKDESDFLFLAATQYFKLCHDAIKGAAPNHLYLGEKFITFPPLQQISVLSAAAPYVDGTGFNYYTTQPDMGLVQAAYNATRKPLFISEFGYTGMDAGLANTNCMGVFPTQQGRAAAYASYVGNITAHAALVSYDWFSYSDAFDGGNCNYGVINQTDAVYTTLTNAIKTANAKVDAAHGNGALPGTFAPYCVAALTCPGNCSGLGCCNTTTGTCKCFAGYEGIDCSINATLFYWNFASGDSSTIGKHFSAWGQGSSYYATYMATVANSLLAVSVSKQGCPSACSGMAFAAGGWHTMQPYGYGTYSVVLRTAGAPGANTELLTNDGTFSSVIQWLFFGATPVYVDIRYYQAGVYHHVQNVYLGFDASQDFHNYTFTWTAQALVFFVDGKQVASASATAGVTLPDLPGTLNIDVFATNTTVYTAPIVAYARSISYQVIDIVGHTCSVSGSTASAVVSTNSTTSSSSTAGGGGSSCDQISWNFASGDTYIIGKHFSAWGQSSSYYSANMANVSNSMLALSISKQGCPSACNGMMFAAGGWRMLQPYQYGTYSVVMKTVGVYGAYTELLTNDGSWSSAIHWLFFGASPSYVDLRYYQAGVYHHIQNVSLGFDSSKDFHNYNFTWTAKTLAFYVDSIQVASVNASANVTLPNLPGSLNVDVFASNAVAYTSPVMAYVKSLSYHC